MTALTATPSADFRVLSEAEVDANFLQLEERRSVARRAAICRHNAVRARESAHEFSDLVWKLREIAENCGSVISYAVHRDVADYCASKRDEYTALQAEYTASADRYGSV